jgi:hypothetical protein
MPAARERPTRARIAERDFSVVHPSWGVAGALDLGMMAGDAYEILDRVLLMTLNDTAFVHRTFAGRVIETRACA